MGDGQTILDSISFNYTYSDTGKYIIELIISNQYGCGDTIQDSVIINPIYTCYIPNAFTPNDDGKNDSFGPVMTAMKSYSIRIYDRWGGIVFNEENKEWDGADYPKGIYNYNIEAIDYKNKVFRYAGKITLAR
jgi:gliding motility-associated-like protein